MADVTVGGVRLHAQRLGSTGARLGGAETVVFVHGLVVDDLSSLYFTLASPVAGTGAEAILYDLRGHGRSERPAAGYSLDDSVADLGGLLDALEVTGPVHVVGNSYGGTVALAFALADPARAASLVLIDSPIPFEGRREPGDLLLETADRLLGVLERLPSSSGRKRNRMSARMDSLVRDTSFLADVRAPGPFPIGALQGVACPVLALYGGESDALADGHRLARVLPRVRLDVVPGAGHGVLFERTALVQRAVLRWYATESSAVLSGAGSAVGS